MNTSKHKLTEQLNRELKHKEWVKKNLPNSKAAKDNQKKILKLYTEIKLQLQWG